MFEAIGCFHLYRLCQEARLSPTEDVKRGNEKRETNQMKKQYIKENGYIVAETWEGEWWNLYKTTTCVKERLREYFAYKRPLREERLLQQIRSGKLFSYVQCDIEVPEELRKNLARFHFFSKKQT